MKRIICLLALVCPLFAGTRILDTVYDARGQRASGSIVLSWPNFTTAGGKPVIGRQVTLPINSGVLDLTLEDNAGANPTVFYTARYYLVGSPASAPDCWVVPTGGPVTLASVRVPCITGAGGVTVTKGTGYVVSRAAVIAPDGRLNAATGSLTDCVRVNGSTSPCGGSSFFGATASAPAFSATPTFSLADVSVKSPTRFEPGALTGNVTAVTFTGLTAGAKFSIAWTQDGTGGRTVTYGGTTANTCLVNGSALSATTQQFEVAADGSTVKGVGCVGDGVSYDDIPAIGPPATPASGIGRRYVSSISKTLRNKADDGTDSTTVLPKDCNALNAGDVVKSIDALGVPQCATPAAGGSNPKVYFSGVGPAASCPGGNTALKTYTFPSSSALTAGDQVRITAVFKHTGGAGTLQAVDVRLAGGALISDTGNWGAAITLTSNASMSFDVRADIISATEIKLKSTWQRDTNGALGSGAFDFTGLAIASTMTVEFLGSSCSGGDTLQLVQATIELLKGGTSL